jgi:ATP-dependent Clp protease ATP-binding subunit ClpA
MLERFTGPARELTQRAGEIARESRASQVRPEHVLAALLWDDRCLGTRVLVAQAESAERLHEELDRRRARYVDGLDDEDAAALASIGIDLAEVVRRIDDGDLEPRRRKHTRFARGSKKVLELSLREAINLGHNYIGTEHVLLGLVRQDDVIVRETLAAAGVDTARLRAAVAEAVRRAS